MSRHQWLAKFDLVKVSDADLAYLYGVPEAELDLDAIAGAPNPNCRRTDCR